MPFFHAPVRRTFHVGLTVVALVTAGSQAAAQGVDEFGPYGKPKRGDFQSAQNFAFEFRFGPYRPDVDSGLAGAPFEQLFGTGDHYMAQFEFDWQAIRLPGVLSFGPGLGFGYSSLSGRAPFTGSAEASPIDNTFHYAPFYLDGVLRFDLLAQQTDIPLAFYGKLGFSYGLWWVDGTSDPDAARGSTYGYNWALGVQLLLDNLDPGSAKEIDENVGVNNTYAFFEWFNADMDGFGSGRLQLGASTWMAGLTLEF